MLNLPQVAEGEEAPPPPPPPPVEEEEEEKEPEKEVWNAYTTVKGLTISISGLKEGKRYKFRVAAKNIMGMSSFTETREPVEIKEQMCKLFCLINKGSLIRSFSHYPMIDLKIDTQLPQIVCNFSCLDLQWNQKLSCRRW